MKLTWIHLRYFPPGLILEYSEENGRAREKLVDLLDLDGNTVAAELAEKIVKEVGETLLSNKHKYLLTQCIEKLKAKAHPNHTKKYGAFRTLRTHAMPMTDATLTKDGSKCLTTSYDRTCKIWDMHDGRELLSLGDHCDIVCCVCCNPLSTRCLTGSFDGTVRYWKIDLDEDQCEAECLHVLRGSDMSEVQTAIFSPDYLLAAAGSSDNSASVYDLTSGLAMYRFEGHTGEVSSVGFDQNIQTLLTASYDSNINTWDLRSGQRCSTFKGHDAEIVACLYNFSCDKIASGSMDSTVRIWDIRNDKNCLSVFYGHSEDVSDVQFDWKGQTLASSSKDGQLLICDVRTCTTRFNIKAHNSAINRIRFSPNGQLLLTCSDDGTAKLFLPDLGSCYQSLEGHTGKVITCAFSYMSDSILTACSDTCRLWR